LLWLSCSINSIQNTVEYFRFYLLVIWSFKVMKRIASKRSYTLTKRAQETGDMARAEGFDENLPAGHPHDGQWFSGTWEDWTKGMKDLVWLMDFVDGSITSMEQTNTELQPARFLLDNSGADRLLAAKRIKGALEEAYNLWQIDDPL
jgi:hypothetical protein